MAMHEMSSPIAFHSSSNTLGSPLSASFLKENPGVELYPTTPLKSLRFERTDGIVTIPTQPSDFPAGRHRYTHASVMKGGASLDQARTVNDIVYRRNPLPFGWIEYVHPDGKPYYHDAQRGIVTELNVADKEQSEAIDRLHTYLWAELSILDGDDQNEVGTKERRAHTELYVGIHPAKENAYDYYFVDHATHDMFWVNLFDLVKYKLLDSGNPTNMNFELFILRNYYRHLENFPCHTVLPADAAINLHGALAFACAGSLSSVENIAHDFFHHVDHLDAHLVPVDHMTSRDSSSTPWDAPDSKTFMDILTGLEEKHKIYQGQPFYDSSYRTWFVSRLMGVILHTRSVHHHGTTEVLLNRLQNIRPTATGVFDFVFGPFAFFAHRTYFQRLETVWADGIVSFSGWQSLLQSLLAEWSDSNLLATVTLSANMAFLALSDLSWIAAMGSIISTFFSIGSIVVGLHHVWRHRDKRDSSAVQAGVYFRNASRFTGSLRPLAWFLALPLIFLSWSLVAFAGAIGVYAFQNVRPIASYVVTGGILGLVICLVGFTCSFFFNIFM